AVPPQLTASLRVHSWRSNARHPGRTYWRTPAFGPAARGRVRDARCTGLPPAPGSLGSPASLLLPVNAVTMHLSELPGSLPTTPGERQAMNRPGEPRRRPRRGWHTLCSHRHTWLNPRAARRTKDDP